MRRGCYTTLCPSCHPPPATTTAAMAAATTAAMAVSLSAALAEIRIRKTSTLVIYDIMHCKHKSAFIRTGHFCKQANIS